MLRTPFSISIALAFWLGLVGCGSSPKAATEPCALPAGYECCDGDLLGESVCGGADNATATCSNGTHLTPTSECAVPKATVCALPSGFVCCAGDGTSAPICAADGGAGCSAGFTVTVTNECTAPVAVCSLPAGYSCCDGDVEGTVICETDGGIGCSAGTRPTPNAECTIATPRDGG